VHLGARIDIEADAGEHLCGVAVQTRAIEQEWRAPARRAPKINILRDVQVRNQREFLEDDGDPQRARVRRALCSPRGITARQRMTGVGWVGCRLGSPVSSSDDP